MYHLVSVDHNGMAAHLTRSDRQVSRRAEYAMQSMMICCGMTVKRMGMLGVSVSKMKALAVNMKTVTPIGKGRQNQTCFLY